MKFIIELALFCSILSQTIAKDIWHTTVVPTPVKYESFETGIPKTWSLQGKGELSLNLWHYKLGKKSLQWDYQAGDVIKINNTVGNPVLRGLWNNNCYACFGIWVYLDQPMPGKKLQVIFRTGERKDGSFDFSLNFKGWQCGFVGYQNYLPKVTEKTDNILIRAPRDSNGRLLIDLVVYNGPRYGHFSHILPNKKPWTAPRVNAQKYPVPKTVSIADKKSIEHINSNLLYKIKITDKGKGTASYKKAMKNFASFDIIEDTHGIRGKGVQVTRNFSSGEFNFYTCNDIPRSKLRGYNTDVLSGTRADHFTKGVLMNTTLAAKNGITAQQYDKLGQKNAIFWKFLLDQGFNTSYGYSVYHTRTFESTVRAVYAVREALRKAGVMDDVFEYVQYHKYGLFAYEAPYVNIDYFAGASTLYYLAFLYSDDPRKQIQALRFTSNRLSREILTDFGANGFKPDGSGYHNTGAVVDYLRNGLRGISKLAYDVSGGSFALSDKAYNRLKLVALRLAFYSNNFDLPIFMQGTSAINKTRHVGYKAADLHRSIRYLSLAGENGCDRELAQVYVNLKGAIARDRAKEYCRLNYPVYDPVFEDKYGIKSSAPQQGNISMPYFSLMAHRRAKWLAAAWGARVDMRDRGNHYGYNIAQGPLSIIGPEGFHASGTELQGWDWNRVNGATVLYMPELIDIKFVHSGRPVPKGKEYLAALEKSNGKGTKENPLIKRGNGGISWRGKNGCFRRIFRGDKFYNDFSAIKTYFFINNRIYALGSNINSDNKQYHVQTNLYQKALFSTKVNKQNYLKLLRANKPDNATVYTIYKHDNTPTSVDGVEESAFPVADTELSTGKAHHLIDTVGNGYFIPGGQKVFVARKTQKSRQTVIHHNYDSEGDYATAWLEHGIACKNAKYSYVVIPYCDRKKFNNFGSKDFVVLRQDDFAHILHDRIDGFYVGIFFKGGVVTKLPHVVNVERDCQIMYREKGGKLEIAVGDPDPHRNWTDKMRHGKYGGKSELTPLKVTFSGSWKLKKPSDGVKVLSSDSDKTVIEFACIHGKTFNFTLEK